MTRYEKDRIAIVEYVTARMLIISGVTFLSAVGICYAIGCMNMDGAWFNILLCVVVVPLLVLLNFKNEQEWKDHLKNR